MPSIKVHIKKVIMILLIFYGQIIVTSSRFRGKGGRKYLLDSDLDEEVDIIRWLVEKANSFPEFPVCHHLPNLFPLEPSPTTVTATTERIRVTSTTPSITSSSTTPRISPSIPDICQYSMDAISLIRGETFIFKDEYVWRIGDSGLIQGYPVLMRRLWSDLPENFTGVDAVVERQDKKIVFFIGNQVWVFYGKHVEKGYPRPLTSLGLPASLEKIDAAMVWSYNSKLYLFSGTKYWRVDSDLDKVELDYPRDIGVWKGVPYYIDAAMQWKDGATFIFKGLKFWELDDKKMRVKEQANNPLSDFFLECESHLY